MTDPREKPVHEYSKIVLVLQNIASELGLELHAFGIIPPLEEDAPVVLQASFVKIDVEGDPEQLEFDEKFKDILMGEQAGIEARAQLEMERKFKNGDGLL